MNREEGAGKRINRDGAERERGEAIVRGAVRESEGEGKTRE